jgi:hypothetical protein
VAKDAAVLDIPQMDGLNPNDIVKAIHIRFLPDATKLDNLCGPKFKDACTLGLRNIIDTQKVMVNGKQKVVTTLKPIATAVAEWKAQNGQSGSSAGSETGQGGSSSQGGQSQGGSSTGSETAEGYALTISTSGSGSASVTKGGNAVTSGASLNEDDEVEISITPAEGETPTATINGSSIELTESEGVYSGSFAMPGQASSLVINTGGSSGGNGGADLDKD